MPSHPMHPDKLVSLIFGSTEFTAIEHAISSNYDSAYLSRLGLFVAEHCNCIARFGCRYVMCCLSPVCL